MSKLKLNLTLFYRHFVKNKLYNSLNTVSLAIGITCFIFITLYLNYEASFDNWHEDFKRIYRTGRSFNSNQVTVYTAPPLAPTLKSISPEIEQTVRVKRSWEEVLLKTSKTEVYENKYYFADSTFFEVFPFAFKYGSKYTALEKENAMVLSEALSKKLFGDSNPIGKSIQINGERLYEVTGVLETNKAPCSVEYEVITPLKVRPEEDWGYNNFITYVKLKQAPKNIETFEQHLSTDLTRLLMPMLEKEKDGSLNYMFGENKKANVFFEAMPNIHLYSRDGSFKHRKTINQALTFIAFALIFLVCINFSNLSMALIAQRMREQTIKYVYGQKRSQILAMNLLETALQCLVALVLALVIAELGMSGFNHLLNVKLKLNNSYQLFHLLPSLGIGLAVIVVACGLYPAYMNTRISKSYLLKGNFGGSRQGLLVRKLLISLQFSITFLFLGAGWVVFKQTRYLQKMDIGFKGDNILVAKLNTQNALTHYSIIKEKLKRNPEVIAVSRANTYPADNGGCSGNTFHYATTDLPCCYTNVDVDYFETLQIPVIEGRTFQKDRAEDSVSSVIINEATLKLMQRKNAVAEFITQENHADSNGVMTPLRIIGVVKNFHRNKFEMEVQPTIYFMNDYSTGEKNKLIVHYKPNYFEKVYAQVLNELNAYNAPFPACIDNLSQSVEALTSDQKKYERLFLILIILSLLISSIGLIALISYTISIRAHEVSIRKVLGASYPSVVQLFRNEYLVYIIVAVILSTPLISIGANIWLETFAYRIAIPYLGIVLAAFLMVMLLLGLITLQVRKFAKAKAITYLKYE